MAFRSLTVVDVLPLLWGQVEARRLLLNSTVGNDDIVTAKVLGDLVERLLDRVKVSDIAS